MSVKKEELKNTKLTAKGVLTEINDEGFCIEDEKTGDVEVLLFDDIADLLVGKSVSISIVNKEEID